MPLKLCCIGSSSKGNGYALIAEDEILLIEAGCKLVEVKKTIDWQVSKAVGCLVSHCHNDHAGRIKEYMQNGIQVFSSDEVRDSIEERGGERINSIRFGEKTRIGNFLIQPFPVVHDVPCVGYLITHPEMGKLVFATDTEYVKYRFQNVNHIMIESNYSKQYLDESEERIEKRRHVLYGHMSIETATDFVQQNNSYDLRNVVLMHLSERNGAPNEFRQKVDQVVSCNVWVAEPGMEITLNKDPF